MRPGGASSTVAALDPAFIEAAREVFGERLDLREPVRLQHGASESHFPVAAPDAVAFAHSTADVVALVRLCARHRTPLIAYGAGTSVEGNTLPVQGGVSLDLSGMDAVLRVNAEDMDCTVEAGVRREQLNAHLRDQGLTFPIDPGANATIGGMAATRASGTNAVRYGTMREAVLALRVVMPDGRDIQTSRRARKSAAGYDLTRLFVGSEGTLGIITEVTLRLHGSPEAISTAVCGFATLAGAVDTVVQAIQLGVPLARVELLDDAQMRAVNAWSKLDYPEVTTLFFEFHGTELQVREQVGTVTEIAASNGGSDFQWSNRQEERSRLWRARHEALYAAKALRPGAVSLITDVCVPISRLAECILQTKLDLKELPMPATIVGHVGDGNFHVILMLDPESAEERKEGERFNEALVRRALALDGTCTGEHGVGLGKKEFLEQELGDAVDVMRAIKRALDPNDFLNPGKIFTL
ncbi:MAG: FAD-binding protein [Caulobacteraceae bacterium]|nr:FAD-binding protein [Caulobacteraceae bacterium]